MSRWLTRRSMSIMAAAGCSSPRASRSRSRSRAPSRAMRWCAATNRANGATGAATRSALATPTPARSTPATSTRSRWRGAGRAASTAPTSTIAPHRSMRTATVHRRDDAPQSVRDRSRYGRDAVGLGDGRRHPLAEGAAPVRRPRPLLLDGRQRHRTRRRRRSTMGEPHFYFDRMDVLSRPCQERPRKLIPFDFLTNAIFTVIVCLLGRPYNDSPANVDYDGHRD